MVIRDDEHEEFDALQNALSEELAPQGAMEELVFQELVHAAWNLHRFRRIEAEVSRGAVEDFTYPATTIVLDRLSRYQARAQCARQKAFPELRVLQTNRALRAVKLTPQQDAELPAIVSVNDLTKQTHSEVTAEAIDLAMKMVDYEAGSYLASRRRSENALK